MESSADKETQHSQPADTAVRRQPWLRATLHRSRQEAAATATTTATSDNFLNAFAIHLNATMAQMSWLTAFPQLIGAWLQLLSVILGHYSSRRTLVIWTAALQGLAVALIAMMALRLLPQSVGLLIGLAALYHTALNLNQPHWRAWLGSLVPARRRGAFFAGRTRLIMLVTVLIFVLGGGLLTLCARSELAWLGFGLLFSVAAGGRILASWLIGHMHDPDPAPSQRVPPFRQTFSRLGMAWSDPVFRTYTLFVASMQGVVAISAPYFAVYMLRDLEFSYLSYSLNSVASIATQFLMLKFWGRVSDGYGNRVVMVLTSVALPLLPLLWLVSPNPWWLIGVQVLSGVAWSGFTLSTGNYLYDIRPHRTHFATYAALQAGISASLVFVGALLGGFVAMHAEQIVAALPQPLLDTPAVFVMFALSGCLRAGIAGYFLPRLAELRVRSRPGVMKLIYRVTRINSISGVALELATVGRRRIRRSRRLEEETASDGAS